MGGAVVSPGVACPLSPQRLERRQLSCTRFSGALLRMAPYQYAFHMHNLTKAYAGGKKVLDNVQLSFYPDAKIGVLGNNGSGKSTLLRIMAGIDKDFSGEARPADGVRVGYLAQEPQLDANKTVRENVMDGVAAQKAIIN
eukprot:gene3910-4873_t